MSSVESTPFNVSLKTQNIKMHFYCYNYDVAYNFKEKKTIERKNHDNCTHFSHINKTENTSLIQNHLDPLRLGFVTVLFRQTFIYENT